MILKATRDYKQFIYKIQPFCAFKRIRKKYRLYVRTKLFSNLSIQFFAFKLFMAFLHHFYLAKSTQEHNCHSWVQAFHLVKVESNLMEKVCRDTLEDIFDILL